MAEKELPDYIINTKEDRATGIRIPRELHAKIQARAEKNYRTMNSMIIALLNDAIERPETEALFLRTYRKLLEIESKLDNLTDKKDKGR